jgi:hypothetical protein
MLSGCAGLITSDLKPTLKPRTAGAITLASGLALTALAVTAWVANDPGSSSGCGSSDPSYSGKWDDPSDDCSSSRTFALVMAVPAVVELWMGTKSLTHNVYPWQDTDDDNGSTPATLQGQDPVTAPASGPTGPATSR